MGFVRFPSAYNSLAKPHRGVQVESHLSRKEMAIDLGDQEPNTMTFVEVAVSWLSNWQQ